MELSDEQKFFNSIKHFATIASLFKKTRFKSMKDEKKLQQEIEYMFNVNNIPYQREVRLNDKDIVDFIVEDIAIEVKTKASVMEIYRQIKRYSDSDKFLMIILVTNRHTRLPRKINNKYTHVINLGNSWL
jgi:hypothetical protein